LTEKKCWTYLQYDAGRKVGRDADIVKGRRGTKGGPKMHWPKKGFTKRGIENVTGGREPEKSMDEQRKAGLGQQVWSIVSE